MTQARFRATGERSFYGDMVYARIVREDHFLRKLDAIVPWDEFGGRLLQYYKGGASCGRPPWNPVLMLKVMMLARLYQLSLRDVECHVNENMPAKWFIGLAVDEPGPDYSTLADFQARLTKKGTVEVFARMLDEIIGLAQAKGIVFGAIQIVDSVHVVADVNTAKDKARKEQGKAPRDADAAWGVKRKRKIHDEKGNEKEIPEYFFGYKQHVSINAANGMVTSLEHTAGNAYDGHQLPRLIAHDLELGLPISIVTADKEYDDGENHYFLQNKKIHSAICLNDYRTEKKDANKEPWVELKRTPEYRIGLKARGRIEAKFGEAKTQHGFRRCCYVGLLGFKVQGYLTAIVLNLKRLVLLLTGVPFSPGITAPIRA